MRGYIQSPCKVNGVDCEKRCVGCHSTCKAYKEYKGINDNARDNERRQKDTIHDYMCVRVAGKRKKR